MRPCDGQIRAGSGNDRYPDKKACAEAEIHPGLIHITPFRGWIMTYTVDTTDVRRLIAEAQSGDVRLADRAASCLISGNMGLVKSIARRFVGRGCEFDDLVQIGTIGMLKAIRSFDLDRGTAFSTYAVPLIIGEIRRHLRDSGLIKVGRATKKLGAELLGARSRIISEEGREPSVSELAAVAGVSPEEAAAAIGAMQAPASLSDTVGSDDSGLELEDRIPDGEGLAELEGVRDRIAIGQAIGRLPPLWRQIVILRYFRNMTQQRTAEALGLTQVKVSREEKKITEFLRRELCG